jgi:hypothetical protein
MYDSTGHTKERALVLETWAVQQNHQCKACGRQFVLHKDNRVIGD